MNWSEKALGTLDAATKAVSMDRQRLLLQRAQVYATLAVVEALEKKGAAYVPLDLGK